MRRRVAEVGSLACQDVLDRAGVGVKFHLDRAGVGVKFQRKPDQFAIAPLPAMPVVTTVVRVSEYTDEELQTLKRLLEKGGLVQPKPSSSPKALPAAIRA